MTALLIVGGFLALCAVGVLVLIWRATTEEPDLSNLDRWDGA